MQESFKESLEESLEENLKLTARELLEWARFGRLLFPPLLLVARVDCIIVLRRPVRMQSAMLVAQPIGLLEVLLLLLRGQFTPLVCKEEKRLDTNAEAG